MQKQACNFIKKQTLAFSCEFYKISKNTFFTEHFSTAASSDINYGHMNEEDWQFCFQYFFLRYRYVFMFKLMIHKWSKIRALFGFWLIAKGFQPLKLLEMITIVFPGFYFILGVPFSRLKNRFTIFITCIQFALFP